MVLREGMRLVSVGIAAGATLALLAAGPVSSMLFPGSARDLLAFTVGPAILALVGAAACWIPALRASRLDPATALRDE